MVVKERVMPPTLFAGLAEKMGFNGLCENRIECDPHWQWNQKMMSHQRQHFMVTAALLTALLLLAACTPPAPPDPATAALEHQYEMGCRPVDLQGSSSPYCGDF